MNERIKKLYTEASEWALHNYPPPVNPFEWEKLRSKKFAELIVRECADWIDRQDESRCPYGIDLLEHFGVE